MYKYTIIASDGYVMHRNSVIIRIVETTDSCAIQKAKEITEKQKYTITEIEEI